MEYYFQQPSTKYDWDDFKNKTFKKDKGEELKRRMLIKNINATTKGEFLELKLVLVHMNALVNASRNSEDIVYDNNFMDLLKFFKNLKSYLQDYFVYEQHKEKLRNGNKLYFKLII